jgi:hypothetical protein
MLDNFLNGNLTIARKQAKRFSFVSIWNTLMFDYGYSLPKALLTAKWLKGDDCWQAACDAE